MAHQKEETGQKSAAAALRIFSETASVEEITALVAGSPSRSYGKGTPIGRRNPSVPRKKAMWALDSPLGSDEDLAAHLKWLLAFIEPRVAVLTDLLTTCQIDLFCGFSSESGQGSTTLDAALLARLGKLPLDLTIDLYPPERPERPI